MNRLYFGLSTLVLTHLACATHAQSVGIGTSTPDSKAALDISAGPSNNKGLLVPRLTSQQRTNVTTTTEGMLVYQSDGAQPGFWYFTNGAWVALLAAASNGLTATNGTIRLGGSLTAATDVATAGFDLTFSGTGRFGFGTTSTNGLFNISGAMGSTSGTGGLNLTNTTGRTTGNTLSITPGYAGQNTGLTTGTFATYDLPGAGNHIFGDNVLPDGNANTLGNSGNRWATIYGTNGNFTGSMTAGVSNPGGSQTANASDYFVVTQAVITYTLPTASANTGRTLIFYAFGGTTTLAVTSGSGNTIYAPDNFAQASTTTYTLARYHRITLVCDGYNWISTAYL